MIEEEYKYSDITEKIIGCAMRVHSTLGNGFQGVIYQRALVVEFEEANESFQRELEMPIFYHDRNIGSRRVDFLIQEKILLELKTVTQLEKVHLAQALNYLEAFKLEGDCSSTLETPAWNLKD
jgi:GxxExxY protein